jgi:electron transfer flavoprotein alpha subunit
LRYLVFLKIIRSKESVDEACYTALEFALRMKEKTGGEIIGVGLVEDEEYSFLYKEAFARGADRVVVFAGKEFIHNDVLSSALLVKKIINYLGGFDVAVFGDRSEDIGSGVLAQIIGGLMGVNVVPFVTGVESIDVSGRVVVKAYLREPVLIRVSPPIIFSVTREALRQRPPSLQAKIAARKKKVELLSSKDLGELPAPSVRIKLSSLDKPVPPTRKRVIMSGEQGMRELVDIIASIVGGRGG